MLVDTVSGEVYAERAMKDKDCCLTLWGNRRANKYNVDCRALTTGNHLWHQEFTAEPDALAEFNRW